MAGLGFSPGSPVSSTNKTDSHDITEILLKVALNTITQFVARLRAMINGPSLNFALAGIVRTMEKEVFGVFT